MASLRYVRNKGEWKMENGKPKHNLIELNTHNCGATLIASKESVQQHINNQIFKEKICQ